MIIKKIISKIKNKKVSGFEDINLNLINKNKNQVNNIENEKDKNNKLIEDVSLISNSTENTNDSFNIFDYNLINYEEGSDQEIFIDPSNQNTDNIKYKHLNKKVKPKKKVITQEKEEHDVEITYVSTSNPNEQKEIIRKKNKKNKFSRIF